MHKIFGILILLILVQLLLLFNSRFTFWPEMLLYPYLINQGFQLYTDLINPYFPLLSLLLASFFKVFGLTFINLKIFTYLIILTSDLVVFWGSYKLSRSFIKAILSVFIYILLQYSFGGNGLWFELALTPLIISSIFLFYFGKTKWEIILASLLFGLSVLIKQNSALFIIPILVLLLFRRQYQVFGIMVMTNLILAVALIGYLISRNIFYDFYFWAVKLTTSYSSQPGFVLMPAKRQYLLIFFPLLSLVSLTSKRYKKIDKIYFALCFLVATTFAFPRYEDFHLQVVVALSAIFAVNLGKKSLLVFLILSILIFSWQFKKLWKMEDRFLDQEMISLSRRISNFENVYLLNSPDLAYFTSGKTPPKPWAINFPWYFEQPGFEDRFIKGLDLSKTKYIVIGERLGGEKYALGNYIPERLMEYIQKNYYKYEKYGKFEIWQKM